MSFGNWYCSQILFSVCISKGRCRGVYRNAGSRCRIDAEANACRIPLLSFPWALCRQGCRQTSAYLLLDLHLQRFDLPLLLPQAGIAIRVQCTKIKSPYKMFQFFIKIFFLYSGLLQKLFICFWRDSLQRARASSFTRILDQVRRTTIGRTPLDEWSARRRGVTKISYICHVYLSQVLGGNYRHCLRCRNKYGEDGCYKESSRPESSVGHGEKTENLTDRSER